MKKVLAFLNQLNENNNRDWFNAHKSEFQAAKAEFEELLTGIIAGLGRLDPRIAGIKPADAVFRIYRDTRFATDKTPYKNNFGAHFSRGGKNSGEPGYYFHVQPGESFLSGGIYMPDGEKLKKIRKEIYLFPEDFTALIGEPAFARSFTFFEDDKLKRPPLGFDPAFPLIEYLKHKHFCPWYPLTDQMLTAGGLQSKALEIYGLMKPFNDFIYRALDD